MVFPVSWGMGYFEVYFYCHNSHIITSIGNSSGGTQLLIM